MDFGASYDYGGYGQMGGQAPFYQNPYLAGDYDFGQANETDYLSDNIANAYNSLYNSPYTPQQQRIQQRPPAQQVAKSSSATKKVYTGTGPSLLPQQQYGDVPQMQPTPQPSQFDTFLRFMQQVGPLLYGGMYGSR